MNPYPGLRPFRQSESNLFMGREIVQGSITTRVRMSPLTLLIARSGVGKSSFLTCRLIPKLMAESAVRYLNEWGGEAPEVLIERALSTIDQGDQVKPEKPLIVLDQFEDVFKLPHPRETLWETLADLVNIDHPPANLLISMREEWLGAWGESSDYLPAGLGTVVRLAPLHVKELTRAIVKPPEIEGAVSVEPQLAELLIRDLRRPTAFGLGDGYVEPGLLQLVCHRLWEEASQAPNRRMTVELYERLGRADRITRSFVWSELGHAGSKESRFTSLDRVLWSGMTRHLVVAQGIKAITDSQALARKIRMEDLGFAGAAVAQARLPKPDREYLKQMPERRSAPPEALVGWISEVVDKGVQSGFLKQQRGLLELDPNAQERGSLTKLFEISHDSLSDMLQQFSVEFESWIRTRWAILLGILFGVLIVAPVTIYLIIKNGWLLTLALLATAVVSLLLYLVFLMVVIRLAELLFNVVAFPIVRRLARGVVPMSGDKVKQRSRSVEKIKYLARRLGFLPR